MKLDKGQVERRRIKPVSRGWFAGVATIVAAALIVASWQATRVYGQQEKQVEQNTRNIDRLEEQQLRDRAELGGKLEKITETLTAQHGTLSALVREMQLERRDREFRK